MIIREEQWAHFIKLIEAGATISDATLHSGMSREVVYKRKDRDPEFANQLEKAIVSPKLRAIATLQKSMSEHWQVAAWWLERKYPEEFALKDRDKSTTDEIPRRMAERAHKILEEIKKRGSVKAKA